MSLDTATEASSWIEVPDDPDDMLAAAEAQGWGDGLPFIPPTRERVERMLAAHDQPPDEVVGTIAPSWAPVTAAKVAANAVMAGCPDAVFPVVFRALAAMLADDFNLKAVQATTHPTAPLVIVHGPIVETAGYNAGTGTMGPATRANVTTGRAIRLCLLNLGGARPGAGDLSTHGSPAKVAYCFAENSDRSPWPPYYVEEGGLEPGQSAVTVMSGEGPHHVNDHVSHDAVGVLSTIASMVTVLGSNPAWLGTQSLIVLGPEHAATVADSGFSRTDVKFWLYNNARMPLSEYARGGMWGMQKWPQWKHSMRPESTVCPIDSPEGFRVVVSGGPGKFSAVIPGDGVSACKTVLVK